MTLFLRFLRKLKVSLQSLPPSEFFSNSDLPLNFFLKCAYHHRFSYYQVNSFEKKILDYKILREMHIVTANLTLNS